MSNNFGEIKNEEDFKKVFGKPPGHSFKMGIDLAKGKDWSAYTERKHFSDDAIDAMTYAFDGAKKAMNDFGKAAGKIKFKFKYPTVEDIMFQQAKDITHLVKVL